MLGVLENHDLTNVCVVVTRYFGGIKLGAGGLIRAYASSVALAIKELGIVQRKEQTSLQVELSYSQYQEYGNFLKEHELEEFDTQFTDKVQTLLYLDKENLQAIQAALTDFYQGKVSYQEGGVREVEIPQPLYEHQD